MMHETIFINNNKTTKIRTFESGATRDACMKNGVPKLSYRGFFSPLVEKCRAEYMNKHRIQSDGNLRDADNWKKGMPVQEYMESFLRHRFDLWMITEGYKVIDDKGEEVTLKDAACACMFNLEGLLHETLKKELEGTK